MSKLEPYKECKICGTPNLKAGTQAIGICHQCIKDEQVAREKRARRKTKIANYNF
jgi:hypothetical protein